MGKRESKRNKASKRKSNSKEGVWTTAGFLQEGRDGIEEDSGLGDSVPFSDEEACYSIQSYNYSQQSLIRHGVSPPFALSAYLQEKKCVTQDAKKLRLDLPEETNELPEEKYSSGGHIIPPLLSFKDVALLSPLKTIQDHGLEFGTTPAFAVQPLSIQRISPTETAMAIVKEEKTVKKLPIRHSLDKIYPSASVDGTVELQLLAQPEQQHRARYQTEGSRGAVKDRSGQGHPIIKLNGYKKSAVLETYVACDGGSVAPHMFYQAYKVSGKNSTPCKEEKIQGTTLLHIDLLPEKEMMISCDCVGLLKERNVDVEQRMKSPMHRGRRKSTKCRLVFRTTIKLESGTEETLQIVSEPICCTQPPGVPEICRKSLSFCHHEGGKELFIIGKNFFKDTKITFQDKDRNEESKLWKVVVTPDKDFLHQTHLICEIPSYTNAIEKDVEVQIIVTSCGKSSEAHSFNFISSSTDKRCIMSSSDDTHNVLSSPSVTSNKENTITTTESTLSLPHKKPSALSRGHAIVHPLQLERSLPSMPLYGSSEHENTHGIKVCPQENTTATTFTPVTATLHPTPNNINDSFKLPAAVEPRIEALPKSRTEPNEAIMENLVEMLKLARNTEIPSAQPAFVQMIADEILNQLKKSNYSGNTVRKPYSEPVIFNQSSSICSNTSVMNESSNIKNEKYQVADTANLYNQRQAVCNTHQYNSIALAKQNMINSDGSGDTILVHSTTDSKISEVKAPSYIINTTNGTLPLLGVDSCNSKISSENIHSSVIPEYIHNSTISSPAKKINLRPVTISRQTLMNNQHTFSNKDDNINNPNRYETINPLYLQGQDVKMVQNNTSRHGAELNLSPIAPVTVVEPQIYPSVTNVNQAVQTSCLQPNVQVSNIKLSVHNTSLYNNQTEIQQTLNLPSHTLNRSNMNSEINVNQNILHNESLTSSSRSLTDPLLSQSTNSELYTPGQGLQMTGNCVNSQTSNATSINSTISSVVTKRFEQLSESELINYINPTCFDNV